MTGGEVVVAILDTYDAWVKLARLAGGIAARSDSHQRTCYSDTRLPPGEWEWIGGLALQAAPGRHRPPQSPPGGIVRQWWDAYRETWQERRAHEHPASDDELRTMMRARRAAP